MTRIRVLHVCHSLRFGGGIEAWVINLFRHNDRQRMQMDYCYIEKEPGDMAEELKEYKADIIGCRMGFDYLSFPQRFAKMLRGRSYDVVHVHCNDFSGPAIYGAKIADVSVRIANYYSTSTGHCNDFKRRLYVRPMRYWIKRDATNILACSAAILKCMWPKLYQNGDKRLLPLYIGVDLNEFREPFNKAAIRSELGIPADSDVVGHIGRFVEVKNQATFLRIAAKISSNNPKARFLLIGEGTLKAEMQKLASNLGIGDKAVFTGHRKDVQRMFAAMDVFLFPSLWEGFGNVVTEAVASGLPVVVSDVIPAASEIGIGPFKELAFPLDNEDIAVKNVMWLLQNRLEAADMVRQCSEELKQFEISDNLKRLEELYRKT